MAFKRACLAVDPILRVRPGVVILAYHRVGGGTSSSVDLDPSAFRAQLDWLAENTAVVTLDDVVRTVAIAPDEPRAAVTFDDGTRDVVDVAVPALVDAGIPTTVYVATAHVEEGRPFGDALAASWAGLRDAVSTGLVDVGSHTHRHLVLDRLDPAAVAEELDRSRDLIADRIGRAARHFAYPKAVATSRHADAAVRARFDSAAVAGNRVNRGPAVDVHRLGRTPVQRTDDQVRFRRKAGGGMRLEGLARQAVDRVRYARSTT